MLGDLNPQTIKIDQQAVVYPGRDHVTTLTIKRYDGRSYRPVDTSALTRVVLVFPDTDPTIAYDSDTLPAVFDWTGSTITIDLSDYAMPASSLPCYLIAFDAEHPAGQVLVDNEDTTLEFDFRNISTTGTVPAPAVEFITDAPVDGETYGRKNGAWVTLEALVSGVVSVNGQTGIVVLDSDDIAEGATNEYYTDAKASAAAPVQSVNGQTGVVTLDAADVGADPAGEAAAEVALHEAALDPHPQYTTAAEAAAAAPVQSVNGETGAVVLDAADVGADASGAAAAAVVAHVGEADPHTQYLTQTEGDARYERGLTAGTNITIDRTNPAAPVISASGGGGGGAVDSVNGQTGVVVLDTDDIAEGIVNLYHTDARVRSTTLTGLSLATVGAVTATDSVLEAFGKLEVTKAPLASPAFTGAPTAPTAVEGSNTTQIATTAFARAAADAKVAQTITNGVTASAPSQDAVFDALALKANLASPTFTGTPAAPTPSPGDNSTKIATTAFVTAAVAGGGGGASLPVVRAITANETLGLAHINTFGVNSTGTDYTVTIQPQSSVTWTADAEIHFLPTSTGNIVITAGAGVSLNGVVAGSITLSTAFGAATIKRIASDSWWLGGVAGQVGASGNWVASGGVANTYTLTPVVARESYVTGDQFRTRFSVTNTGATTVNVSGLGAKTCLTVTGAALPAGYIRTDADTVLSYDGTNFVVDRLVERGSNANGDFVRRADGSLECRFTGGAQDATFASGSVFVTATPATWTFPAAYSAKPWVGYAPEETVRLGITYATSTTAATYRQMRFATSAATQTGELSAKGFWY